MQPRILVIGLGGTLRGDDALGRVAAEQLRAVVDPGQVTVIDRYGPTPELAAELARHECAIFLDASVDGPLDRVVTRRVQVGKIGAVCAHGLGPSDLLGLAHALYGHVPECYAVTFRARSFDLADRELSPPLSKAPGLLVDEARRLIREFAALAHGQA